MSIILNIKFNALTYSFLGVCNDDLHTFVEDVVHERDQHPYFILLIRAQLDHRIDHFQVPRLTRSEGVEVREVVLVLVLIGEPLVLEDEVLHLH